MIVPEYEAIDLRLDWPRICAIACRAMILDVDFERMCEYAIQFGLRQRGFGREVKG